MSNYENIGKGKPKVKCSRCGLFKDIRYKNNFKGGCVCDDCISIQNFNYNRQILIPSPIAKAVGFHRGDSIKLIINKNNTLTLEKLMQVIL